MKQSILTEVHRAAGAHLQEQADPPLLLTYGDVPAEYAAATKECAIFDATDRDLILVGGKDAESFLHRLLANRVRDLEPGQGNRNLLLTPKGKILFEFLLSREPEGFRLSAAPGDAPGLMLALDTYLFGEAVELVDATQDHAPLALVGPKCDAVVRSLMRAELSAELAAANGASSSLDFEGTPLSATRAPVAGSNGLLLDAGPERAGALWAALVGVGAVPCGLVARDILRVEAGAALAGVDIDENVYPQEARLEEAFSLEKGCYVGQEVVAKIDTYGGLNKRLVCLRISHDDPVSHGTRLYREEKGEWRDLGVITSWSYSFVLDTGLVLAYVKRKHQAVGSEFRLGDGPASATIVPMPVREGALAVSGEFE